MTLAFLSVGPIELMILGTIGLAMLFCIPLLLCLICRKAGYPTWYGVLFLLPLVNLVLLGFLAFTDWPATRVPSNGIDTA